jgi:hypothetical protein
MPIDLYFVLVLRLTAGALAIQSPTVPLSLERASSYAAAAGFHGVRAGVDPFELIAVARNESDFVEDSRGPDGKDCGLTQTRVTISRFSCRQLRRSYWLAFQEAARELSEYARACRAHSDFDRCRLNRYNSGARYARRGVHGAYWLRVQCFADAARDGVPVGQACRQVRGRRDITRVIRRARPPAPSLVAAAAPPTS